LRRQITEPGYTGELARQMVWEEQALGGAA
jgi:hypothetical protein